MTRNREIYFLLKTKLVPYAYPHILNIFQFTDARCENEIVKNQKLNLIILGDEKVIKRHESFAFLQFLCRIFLGCGLLLVITLPAYWGFANVVFTSYSQTGLAQLSILVICFLINSLQIVFFGFSESKVVKKYFYLNS